MRGEWAALSIDRGGGVVGHARNISDHQDFPRHRVISLCSGINLNEIIRLPLHTVSARQCDEACPEQSAEL
jgi:hypothetical protein